jgi:hypothetical protein
MRSTKKATASYLEDVPRRPAVDPQCLIQRSVERGAMIAQLLPQLLLLLSVDEEGGWRVDALLPLPRVRCWAARASGGGVGRRGLDTVP